ncbi:MAG: response regulator [Pseudomonadota bacterium]
MARILVAEDEEILRSMLVHALTARGHEVVAAADGGIALDRLAAQPFDLLIADIVMPVMDGVALALKASAEHPLLKIVMMTGYVDEKRRAHNLEALIHAVIAKPFAMEDMARLVDAALAG